MALRQLGEAIDLRRAIPDVKTRIGPQGYDTAIKERLRVINDIGNQQNAYSAQQAYERQQAAYQQRLAALNNQMSSGGPVGSAGAPSAFNGKYYSILGGGKTPTFGYGARYKESHGGTMNHRGLDFAVPVGTSYYAPTGGTIVRMGDWGTGFGNALGVRFDNNTYGIFGHGSGFADGLKVGSKFTPGQLLGYTGRSGDVTGAHLHFETRYNLYDPGTSFDPSSWFGW